MRDPKRNVRQTKAAVLGIALSLAMVLVIICLGIFALSLFFGGQRETQPASDAGALNVGNKSVNLSVQLLPGEERRS